MPNFERRNKMKGHAKRWLSMLVVLCMIFTLAVPMYAAAQTEDITILYTNDIHTYINNGQVGDGDQAHDSWSYSRLASYKRNSGGKYPSGGLRRPHSGNCLRING